jgi:hypothetical protein
VSFKSFANNNGNRIWIFQEFWFQSNDKIPTIPRHYFQNDFRTRNKFEIVSNSQLHHWCHREKFSLIVALHLIIIESKKLAKNHFFDKVLLWTIPTWSVAWSVVQKFHWRKCATLLQNHKQKDSSGHENDISERSNHEYMMI